MVNDTIGTKMQNKIDEQVEKINEEIENPVFQIKKNLEAIEDILLKYLLVLPTSNNPKSSRAFTIVKLLIDGKVRIQFIDLPGLEKKSGYGKRLLSKITKEEIKRGITSKKEKIPGRTKYSISDIILIAFFQIMKKTAALEKKS